MLLHLVGQGQASSNTKHPVTKNYPSQNVNSAEAEKLRYEEPGKAAVNNNVWEEGECGAKKFRSDLETLWGSG